MTADREAAIRELLAEISSSESVSQEDFDAICDEFPKVLAELAAAREREGNLTLELEAERHNHRKDNEHLLARDEKLRVALRQVRHGCLMNIRRAAFGPEIGVRYTEKIRAEIDNECWALEQFIDAALSEGEG